MNILILLFIGVFSMLIYIFEFGVVWLILLGLSALGLVT